MSRPIFLARAVNRSDLFAHRISDVRYFLPLQSRFEKVVRGIAVPLDARRQCATTNLVHERYRAKMCDIIDYHYRDRLWHTVRPLSPALAFKETKLVVGSLYSMIDRWHGIRAFVYYSRIDHERGRYRNRRRSVLRVSRG